MAHRDRLRQSHCVCGCRTGVEAPSIVLRAAAKSCSVSEKCCYCCASLPLLALLISSAQYARPRKKTGVLSFFHVGTR